MRRAARAALALVEFAAQMSTTAALVYLVGRAIGVGT